jgi:hypothetical protein
MHHHANTEIIQALARACKPPDETEVAAQHRKHLTGAVLSPSGEELETSRAQATAPAQNTSCMQLNAAEWAVSEAAGARRKKQHPPVAAKHAEFPCALPRLQRARAAIFFP